MQYTTVFLRQEESGTLTDITVHSLFLERK